MLHVAEEHSCYHFYGQVCHLDDLYQEQPMLWPDLCSMCNRDTCCEEQNILFKYFNIYNTGIIPI